MRAFYQATLEGEDKEDKEDGIEIFDDPVVKPSFIEIINALNTLQILCLDTTC